jgi:hypothetical protein
MNYSLKSIYALNTLNVNKNKTLFNQLSEFLILREFFRKINGEYFKPFLHNFQISFFDILYLIIILNKYCNFVLLFPDLIKYFNLINFFFKPDAIDEFNLVNGFNTCKIYIRIHL